MNSTLQHWESVLEEASAVGQQRRASASSKKKKKAYHLLDTPKDGSTSPAPAPAAASSGPAVSRAAVEEITSAWQEAAQAAEQERATFEAELIALRSEHEKTLAELQLKQRRLESTEISMEAYMEAAQASADAAKQEVSAALLQANARSEARTKVLESKADMATRDVSTLRAQKLLHDVHSTTLNLELGLLDGSVGVLGERLRAAHDELEASLRAQAVHQERADAATLAASAATLEATHLRTVVSAQKRTIDELKAHVAGAQVWAREAENAFDETLVAIRYAAAEQLTVQSKRLRAWEEEMERHHHGADAEAGGGGLVLGRAAAAPAKPHRRGSGKAVGASPAGLRQGGGGGSSSSGGIGGRVAELLESESDLIARQARLFTEVRERTDNRELKTLTQRLQSAEAELDAIQRNERDFASELQAVGARDYDALLQNAHAELHASRARLRETERTLSKMEERLASEIALHRTRFDTAVSEMLDQASRLTTAEADALVAAAADDPALVQLQGSGVEGGAEGARGGAPRRGSVIRARDKELLKSMGSTPAAAAVDGGGDEDGDGEGDDGRDAALLAARRRVAELEEEMQSRLEEVGSAATRQADQMRRDVAATTRWAHQLEEQLEQSNAALTVEREEGAKLESECARLQQALGEAEERARVAANDDAAPGPSSSSAGAPSFAPTFKPQSRKAAFQSFSLADGGASDPAGTPTGGAAAEAPSRRIAKARAVIAMPTLTDEDATPSAVAKKAGAASLVVGTPARPSDVALRPPANPALALLGAAMPPSSYTAPSGRASKPSPTPKAKSSSRFGLSPSRSKAKAPSMTV